MVELEETMHGVIREGGHGDHLFGPTIHGTGIDFEESPLPRAMPSSTEKKKRPH